MNQNRKEFYTCILTLCIYLTSGVPEGKNDFFAAPAKLKFIQ
jgi:hypothetical protein